MCKQNCRKIFFVIKHEKVNTKGISQGCGTRSYIRLMLNKLKEMGGFTFIYTLKDLTLGGFYARGFHVATN